MSSNCSFEVVSCPWTTNTFSFAVEADGSGIEFGGAQHVVMLLILYQAIKGIES